MFVCVQMRLNSVRRLSTIALALGEERTRTELIPFLKDSLEEEDEILQAVAEELAKFVPLVGGPAYAHTLLPPLESLAVVDETVVREKAVDTLQALARDHSTAQLEQFFCPLIKRLAAGDWFSARSSACGLFVCCYSRVSPQHQTALRQLFTQLCHDDTPMVRRSAATHLGKLAEAAGAESMRAELLPLFSYLMQDDQDTVRMLAADASVQFAKLLPRDEAVTDVLPALHNASKDRSWRVRCVVAEKWAELQKSFGPEIARTDLVPMLVRLLQDQEPEVRSQTVGRLPDIGVEMAAAERAQLVSTAILPHVTELCGDLSPHVRTPVAAVIVHLAPMLGKDRTLEQLLPLLTRLLRDEHADVRLNVIGKLDVLQAVIGVDAVTSILVPEITALADDAQWRVRLAVIEQMPLLGRTLGQDVFDARLTALVLTWLSDNVFAIREAATRIIHDLIKVFGLPWAKKSIVPRLAAMGSDAAYLKRLTTLFAINAIADQVDSEVICKDLGSVVAALAKDPVPNVRLNVARTIAKLTAKPDPAATAVYKPVLEQLKKDTDVDVQYFAQHALALL